MYAIRHKETKTLYRPKANPLQVRVYDTKIQAAMTLAWVGNDYEMVHVKIEVVC